MTSPLFFRARVPTGRSASRRSRRPEASFWSRIRTRLNMDRCPAAPWRLGSLISFCPCARSQARLPELIRDRRNAPSRRCQRNGRGGDAAHSFSLARPLGARLLKLQEVDNSPANCPQNAGSADADDGRIPFFPSREHPHETQALFADLLISVTTFFRDTNAFEKLAALVIPRLFDNKGVSDTIRVWVAGCATGEEAYSIAILLLEEANRHEIRCGLQVFASDLDDGALIVAREGRYPDAIEADMTEDTVTAFLYPRGRPLSCDSRVARHRADRQAQPSEGSAILSRRPHFLSQRPHLPRPRGAAAGYRHIPLCLAAVRLPLPRLVRKRRRSRWGCFAPSTGKRASISACPFRPRCGSRRGPPPRHLDWSLCHRERQPHFARRLRRAFIAKLWNGLRRRASLWTTLTE